jgi:hypothetical protein
MFVTATIYVPANATDTVRGGDCLPPPYAYFERQIAEGVTLRVRFHWWGGDHSSPHLEITGSLEDGRNIKFLENRVKISSASGISVVEFGGLLPLDRGHPGMRPFFAVPRAMSVSGIANRTEPIVVSLPRIIANGTYVEVAPITFKPEQYSGLCMAST